MKYLDLVPLQEVDLALNFDTETQTILGAADVFTIKAAGGDKKLYRRVEQTLERRYQALLRSIAGMSPQTVAQMTAAGQLNTGRNSPFGTFHTPSNRHKLAYLIATLNATHIDYDFANALRVDDFYRVSKMTFMNEINMQMRHLRPNYYPSHPGSLPLGAMTPTGSPIWSQRQWAQLDSEMSLNDCEYYLWQPVDDPYADDGILWSYHFFLYNQDRKRVCYFQLRGLSALSNSPTYATSLMSKCKQSMYESGMNAGSRKRAEYWLGDRATFDELDDMVIDHPEDVVDAEEVIEYREASLGLDYTSDDESDVESLVEREREKSAVRAMSEHVMERMEV